MNCAACGHTNPERAKFCLECGTPMSSRCASCGVELPPAAKFCLECGTRTAAAPSAPASGARSEPKASEVHQAGVVRSVDSADTRKVVTIIFGDLVGSTALHERLDAESVRQFMESYYAAMRGAVEAHGGRVTQVMGDGVKAVFGAPRVAEDDAIRAVRAGVEMQQAFRALAEQQRDRVGTTGLRVAVNTGEVVANDETEIIGDPVNVAARLQEQGKDGDVVIGESTHRLVSTLVTLELLGSFALKGRSEAVKAYRVVSLDRPAGAATAPFVGRDEELTRLTAVYETAVEKPAAGLAVLVGSPGLGKSRLIDEFARRHADAATVVRASCDAAGAATFAPLADALRTLLGIESGASTETLRATVESALPAEDADRARIANGIATLLAGAPPSPEETFFVVRRLLGALAQTKPVVLVIDDLHWAEPLLLDLVEHLIQWGSGVPLLVVIGARPELRELRSSLVTPGGLVSDVITLAGLDAGAAMRLAANAIGASDLPAAIAAKVLATSEGNPLFVGELVRMLVQEGAITREGDRWIAGANLAALEMPPTIHALLAARIERLRAEERTVLERAAVVGRHFSRSAVAALLPHSGDLDARLEALRRSELIERDTGWLLGEPVLRFHHVLIRDAAYRRLLKGTRAELHAKLADWIEAQVGDAPEHDEMIGWHLEQAHAFLRELGPPDASGQRLGERAATRLAAAGRRALARDDLAVAANLLGRAIERLDAEDPTRADLALDWCEALLAAGDVGPAAAAIAELERFTADSERLRAWHTCFVGQHTVLTAPSALHETTDAVAAAADALTAQGDAAGEAKAHYVHALALSRLGKVGACEAALDRALAAARRAGDRRRANTVLAIAPLAALWGPSPVTRASGRCLDVVRVLRITQGAPAVEAVALSCQGVLEALRGRTEAARRMIASARKMVEELGITQRLLEADVSGGLVALLEGDASAAERSLRGAYDGLRDLGLGIDAARAAALLARALLAQDRADEAEALSHESEALAGDDLKAAIAWRGVRAEALARRGEHGEAIALATRAVELAAATDALLDHADARIALAAALRAAGRASDADAEERRARELWQAKGATLLAERARGEGAHGALRSVLAEKPIVALPASRRRVRPNLATAAMDRSKGLMDARDWAVYEAQFHKDFWTIEHPTGATYGREAAIASLQRLFGDRDPHFAQERVATLGEFLVLNRRRHGAAGSATGARLDFGAYENEVLALMDVDGNGLYRHSEVFAADRLGYAIARLYERHAELLPEGPARDRSAAAARAFGTVLLAPADPDPIATSLAPDFESIDHRHLSLWSLRGGEAFLDAMRALHQVAADVVIGVIDVLALGPSALLVRRMHAGTERVGGGTYERPFLVLFATDTAGRLVRAEWFDADGEAEALACFDALAGDATPAPPVRRRPSANAATAIDDRFVAAVTARDLEAARACFDPSFAEIDHSIGSQHGHDPAMAGLEYVFHSPDLVLENERLATLGSSLLLARRSYRGSSFSDAQFETGDWRHVQIALEEAGDQGRFVRAEVFAPDRLGEAVARLYERYAELAPDGPERERAAARARAVAALLGPVDFDAWQALIAADSEFDDRRLLGFGLVCGREANLPYLQSLFESSESVSSRIDDVLGLEPAAFLLRWTETGVAVGGGDFERVLLKLFVFTGEGLASRYEYFDIDREAEALARFDALAGRAAPAAPLAKSARTRRVHANAATAVTARVDAAIAAGDIAAFAALLAPALEFVEHQVGASYGHAQAVAGIRALLRAREPRWREEPIATLGSRLGLFRRFVSARATIGMHFDVGASEIVDLTLCETDGAGATVQRLEVFSEDKLGDAAVRLYERYAELLPDGPERVRAEATARSFAAMAWSPEDPEARLGPVVAPDFVGVDHRHLSGWSLHGASAYVEHMRALRQVADDIEFRCVDILALAPNAQLTRILHTGTDRAGGGVYERPFLSLFVVDADGKLARAEWFDEDREAEALARFDALVAKPAAPARRVRANAATASVERFVAALDARDAGALPAFFDDALRVEHHPTGSTYGRREMLKTWRSALRAERLEFRREALATLGDTLVLSRQVAAVAGLRESFLADFGATEIHEISLIETDAGGRWIHVELFAPDRLGDALGRLFERHAAQQPEGPARARAEATARAVAVVAPGGFDHDRYEAVFRPDAGVDDHRLLGFGRDIGPQTLFRSMAAARVVGDQLESGAHDVLAATHDALLLRWLTSGVGRESGGAFEWAFLRLFGFDADGCVARYELFDSDREAEALARLDVLVGTGDAAPREHPFANAASRANRRRTDTFNARDWAGFETCVSPDLVFDERRRLLRNVADREVWLAQMRLLFDLPESRFTVELLATRGERLSLHRHEFEGRVADGGGPLELDPHLALHEVDRDGRIALIVLFDLEDADAAYDQLDARFASDEASTNPRAVRALRSNHFVRARDWPAFAAAHVSGFVYRDHRLLGWGSTVGDLAALLRLMQSTVELVPDAQYRYDHVRIAAHGTLRQTTLLGTRDGGAFESPMLLVGEVDEQGLIARTDSYDVDDLDRALARFAELAAPARAESRFANAASRALDKLMAAWSARAWDAFARVLAGEHRQFDRRRLVQLALDREQAIAFARQIGEMAATRVEADLLATRGDRLALSRLRVEAADGAVGPSEIVSLMLTETNDRGECSGQVRFDADDQGAALAELDARWEAGEAAQRPLAAAWAAGFRRAFASRDWDAMSALQAQGQVANDYRLVGWGTLRGAGAWTPTLRELVALAPDVRQRVDHLRVAERGLLWHHAWQGTREGGEFESLLLLVVELDEDGRERRVDVWEADRFDAALARFAEIAAPARTDEAAGHFENTASRAWRAVNHAWTARDLERFAAPHAADLRYRDHRRLFELDLDRAGFLDFTRPLLTMRAGHASLDLVATRGERLALMRSTLTMEDEAVGPSAIDSLMLIETDERGEIAAYDRWDLVDLDAAYAELDARWPASEGAEDARAVASFQAFGAALDRHDWDAVAGFYASAFVGHDHRLASWGTLHGGAAFQETFRTLVELAPDVRMRRDHMRVSSRSMLLDAVWVGTRDGGAFESPFVAVQEFDAGGQVVRADFHDPHHLDRALARFEEIRASDRRDPLAAIAKPNAATAALDRWHAAFDAGDWDAIRALAAPGMRIEDRRRLARIEYDPETAIADWRQVRAAGVRPERTLLGTAGERIAIERLLWVGGQPGGRFEVEFVWVSEVNEAGHFSATIAFDPEDARAAQREASARWAAIDPTVAPKLALMSSAADSFNERDRTRMRAIFADDLVVEDHRRAGMGRIEGGDAYTASIAVLWDLASVTTVEFGWYWPAIAPEGALITIRRTGDVAGGGPFESDYLYLFLHAHGRITRIELFELEDLDAALARFEEVHARERRERFATGVGPNLATAAMARNWAAFDVIDLDAAQEALDAARAQYAPDFVWDDRRPLVGLTGDLDLMVASARERLASGARHERRTILGTAGDRVAIGRVLWAGGPADGRFEVEFLVVTEVNEAGLFTAHVFFEPGDTRGAQREAWARWAAIDPVVAPWVELLSEITDAWNARDVARLLAILGDDFVIEDHRLAGLGRIEGAAAYMDANVVLWDLAPDQRVEFGSSFDAYDRHGLVATMRRIGTLPDGGAFESDYVWFSLARDGRITHLEFFEVEQRDEALARFEALRPDPLRAPETAATRMRDRNRDAFLARDWDAMRTLTGTDFVFEDRGKRALLRGDAESWIASMEFTSQPGFRTDTALIGTLGDRIALDRVRWFGKPGGDAFEFERVRLLEVGADGLLRLVVFFDPEDRFAAAVEGLEHFVAGEAAGSAGIAPLVAFVRARFDRSWDAVRECLAPDLVFVDQRPLGFGTLDREQWIASLQAGDDLGDGVIMEVYRVLAWSEHGHVVAIRRFGAIADGGGPFEVEAILTGLVADGRIRRIEVFGEADAERAVARFAELCAARAAE